MSPNIIRISSCLGLILVSANVRGSIVAPQSISTLQQSSDAIVDGTTTALVKNGSAIQISIKVDRVIKGDLTITGNIIATYWDSTDQDVVASPNSAHGMWFLQRTGSAWKVIPVIQGTQQFNKIYFPVPPGPISTVYAYTPAASVEDKLAAEISFAIENDRNNSFQLLALQTGVLDALQSPTVQLLYQRMAGSTSTPQKILGLSGLIRAGDATALSPAVQAVPTLRDKSAEGILILSIREHFRATDIASVAVVGQAANSTNLSLAFREAAAHALASIHTSATLPFLAKLLDDPDLTLRVEAVWGMGAFANGLAVQTRAGGPSLAYLQLPNSAPYKTADTVAHLAFGSPTTAQNEASYISFWKDWWSHNRTQLGY